MSVLSVPYVEWNEGASRLKASRGSDGVQVGGGRRGPITGFSADSRRRLLQKIACVDRDAPLPMFMTQTYPDRFPSPREAKHDLDVFYKRAVREFPSLGAFKKLEPQERGAPHFHSLVWGVPWFELFQFTVQTWYDIAGQGDINHLKFHMGLFHPYRRCVEPVRSFKGVWFYAAKYLGKTFEVDGWEWPGRFWGVVNPRNIPFGKFRAELVGQELISDVLRYGRRFAGLAHHHQGATIFCDADQWVQKLKITAEKALAAEIRSTDPLHGGAAPLGKSASCDETQSGYASGH